MYVTRDKGEITEVRCKGCPTVIRSLATVKLERAQNSGNLLERHYIQCVPNASYREVKFEMKPVVEDENEPPVKQYHVTCLCSECADFDMPTQVMEAYYREDMEQLRETGGPSATLRMGQFKPVKVVEIGLQVA